MPKQPTTSELLERAWRSIDQSRMYLAQFQKDENAFEAKKGDFEKSHRALQRVEIAHQGVRAARRRLRGNGTASAEPQNEAIQYDRESKHLYDKFFERCEARTKERSEEFAKLRAESITRALQEEARQRAESGRAKQSQK